MIGAIFENLTLNAMYVPVVHMAIWKEACLKTQGKKLLSGSSTRI